jgi:hypothetical protein
MTQSRLEKALGIGGEFVFCGLADGLHGGENATTFGGDLCIRGACNAACEFMCARARKDHVRV